MSEELAELTRRAFESLGRGGVEAMLPYVHEEFEMTTPPQLASEPGTYSGHDGVRRWFSTFYEAMDEVMVEPRAIEVVGERVAIALRISARGRSTGLEVVQEAGALCTILDLKVRRMEFFSTLDEALEAARA